MIGGQGRWNRKIRGGWPVLLGGTLETAASTVPQNKSLENGGPKMVGESF